MTTRRNAQARHGSRRPVGRRRSGLATAVLVFGELLVTAGVTVLAFVAWQIWIEDPSVARAQTAIADDSLAQWAAAAPAQSEPVASTGDVPIAATPGSNATVWGVLYVPRFGDHWRKPIAWGTDMDSVLNRIGVGTYVQSTMPGAIGNTILASHRAGMGSSFYAIDTLRLGDRIVIETASGWYTYAYRNTVYILNVDVQVLDAVPMRDGVAATSRILTLQSCNPLPVSNDERIMAFAVLESFTPRSDGVPALVSQMGGE